MSEQNNENVGLIVAAMRESHLASSVALFTVGELVSEEIKSRLGKQDASFGHIGKALCEDVKNAGGVGFDPSYISRALATYGIAVLLNDVDIVQKVPAYACKMVATFVKRMDEAPEGTPFNVDQELVYDWKEEGLADVAREFLTGVRDDIITFAGAGQWMKKALADRQCTTKAGGHPDLRRDSASKAQTTEGKIAGGWEKALCPDVKGTDGKTDAKASAKAAAKGIKAAVKTGVLSVSVLLVAVKAAVARDLEDGEDCQLGAWEAIQELVNAHVDAIRGTEEEEEDELEESEELETAAA
jgi:hypothetical protein